MQYSNEDIIAKFKRMKEDGSTDNHALEIIADLNGADKETIWMILHENKIQCRKPKQSRKEKAADDKKRANAKEIAELAGKSNQTQQFEIRAVNHYISYLQERSEEVHKEIEELNSEIEEAQTYLSRLAHEEFKKTNRY